MPVNYNMGTVSFDEPTGVESPGYPVNTTNSTMTLVLSVTGFPSGTIVAVRVATTAGDPSEAPPGNLVAAEKKTLVSGTTSYTLNNVPIPSITGVDFLFIKAWIWNETTDDYSTKYSRTFTPVAS